MTAPPRTSRPAAVPPARVPPAASNACSPAVTFISPSCGVQGIDSAARVDRMVDWIPSALVPSFLAEKEMIAIALIPADGLSWAQLRGRKINSPGFVIRLVDCHESVFPPAGWLDLQTWFIRISINDFGNIRVIGEMEFHSIKVLYIFNQDNHTRLCAWQQNQRWRFESEHGCGLFCRIEPGEAFTGRRRLAGCQCWWQWLSAWVAAQEYWSGWAESVGVEAEGATTTRSAAWVVIGSLTPRRSAMAADVKVNLELFP